MRIIDKLKENLRKAAVFDPGIQAAPACILWPDRDRQWEPVIRRMQNELPELFTLGNYDSEKRTGPAIWLRCIVAGKIEDVQVPEGRFPIVYLPGISRQDLRVVESCEEQLKPLVEMQYRGVIWSQINAKDWTILAFLKSDQGGLGQDAAQDNDSKNAMQLALYRILDEEIELLKGKRLDKDYFNKLIAGGDPVRDLLQWIDQGDAYQSAKGENEWNAFVEVCKSHLAFDPHAEGVLSGTAKLAGCEGPWHPVWERFCESPKLYSNIPDRIRQCQMPPVDLFSNAESHGAWPQWNESEERSLQNDLKRLKKYSPHDARNQILSLERTHAGRRKLVWADIGESPLALAMAHLAVLAEITGQAIAAGTVEDMAGVYQNSGWLADRAAVQALGCVSKPDDLEAVSSAIRSVYLPWLEESAIYLQKIVDETDYPNAAITTTIAENSKNRECIIFVDGLRFDAAKLLAEMLTKKGCHVKERTVWAALPSVTATGKPAVSPVRDKITGNEASVDFEPILLESGQSLKGGHPFSKLLNNAGWTLLEDTKTNTANRAWCEFGNIDHQGHVWGWKLSRQIDDLLGEIRDRILQLIADGWDNIYVVTDHGWLLMPGGLPKSELPGTLTDNKWGRCAVIKSGAATEEQLYPWHWNPNPFFALATGVNCFRKGMEYAHGGLSLQECLTLELTVSVGASAGIETALEFTDIVWKGLRCTIALEGRYENLALDIRTQAGDPSTSVVVGVKPIKDNGTSSVVVEDEDFEGGNAFIVLIDSDGELVSQLPTIIGGRNK